MSNLLIRYNDVKKARDYRAARKDLVAFIDKQEPHIARGLKILWKDMSERITLADVETAIEQGYVSENLIEQWRKHYAKFVIDKMLSLYNESIIAGGEAVERNVREYIFDPQTRATADWATNHAAQLIQRLTEEQRIAINGIIAENFSSSLQRTSYVLARQIRSNLGLLPRQMQANNRYMEKVYATLVDGGLAPDKAWERAGKAAERYGKKQLTYRAQTVARTEIATAYNVGADEGMKDAYNMGLLGKYEKHWITAGDGVVCEHCAALDRTSVDTDGDFSVDWEVKSPIGGTELRNITKKTPPLHPRCRCAIQYIEIEPPNGGFIQKKVKKSLTFAEIYCNIGIRKHNPYHDSLGRFASGPGGSVARGSDNNKSAPNYFEIGGRDTSFPQKWTPNGFSHKDTLQDHYERHGSGVGAKSATDYEAKAKNFLTKPLGKSEEMFVNSKRGIYRYDYDTKIFGAALPKGTIKTYMNLSDRKSAKAADAYWENEKNTKMKGGT